MLFNWIEQDSENDYNIVELNSLPITLQSSLILSLFLYFIITFSPVLFIFLNYRLVQPKI